MGPVAIRQQADVGRLPAIHTFVGNCPFAAKTSRLYFEIWSTYVIEVYYVTILITLNVRC